MIKRRIKKRYVTNGRTIAKSNYRVTNTKSTHRRRIKPTNDEVTMAMGCRQPNGYMGFYGGESGNEACPPGYNESIVWVNYRSNPLGETATGGSVYSDRICVCQSLMGSPAGPSPDDCLPGMTAGECAGKGSR